MEGVKRQQEEQKEGAGQEEEPVWGVDTDLSSRRKGKVEATGVGDPLGDVVAGWENGVGERKKVG